MSDWLQNLKAGDKVIIVYGFGDERLVHVDRTTATQIIVGNVRYQRRTGNMVGADSWSRCGIYEATPERAEKVRKKKLAHQLASYKWHDYPLKDLEVIWAAVKTQLPPTARDGQS